jgi:DNA-binding MarR family transcriptional regulator
LATRTKRRDEPLGRLLAQVCKLLRDRVHAGMEGIGLGRGQGFILARLGEEDGLAQADLARKAWVRPATLTAAVQRLEEAGLIERKADPADARISRVYLTPQGETVRRQVEAIWGEVEVELEAILGPAEQTRLASILRRLRDALREDDR